MEYNEHYKDMIERNTICKDFESRGFHMSTDNFDNPKWKRGDPIVGTMIFTDEIPVSVIPEPVRDPLAEIDKINEKLELLLKEVTNGT